jgi:hypothetical protein
MTGSAGEARAGHKKPNCIVGVEILVAITGIPDPDQKDMGDITRQSVGPQHNAHPVLTGALSAVLWGAIDHSPRTSADTRLIQHFMPTDSGQPALPVKDTGGTA